MTQDNRKSQKWQIKREPRADSSLAGAKRGKRGSQRARQLGFEFLSPQPRVSDRLTLDEIAAAALSAPATVSNLPQPQQPIPAAGASARPEDSSDPRKLRILRPLAAFRRRGKYDL